MRTLLAILALVAIAIGGYALIPATAGPPLTSQDTTRPPLVVHEWGTFTSYSGSDGVPVGFTPNNDDLPSFVYNTTYSEGKGGRFRYGGLVSMETPVIYFYTDRAMKVGVKVDFPRGWITEW